MKEYALYKGEDCLYIGTIKEIAKRVQGVVNKNMNDSIRIARTETTRLESIGREEVFNKGQDMGLKMKKVFGLIE